MTINDYDMTMNAVKIAELKARLSEYLRAVRKGREILVLDRNTPVARIVPSESGPLEVRRAVRRPQDLPLPRRISAPTDSLAVLLEDRGRR
jgi:prevent-host-death family protein